jgi:hypothetical protein
MNILHYTPGQKATIVLETVGPDGYRMDSLETPQVAHIWNPALKLIDGYAGPMIPISTGLYVFYYTIPTGASAVGSYLIDVTYIDPVTSMNQEIIYQLIVNAPYGIYSAM